MKIPPAAKVGLLTIIALVLLIFSIMWLKGRSLASGERLSVQFGDVDGMRPGSMVQIMGIRIGQVEQVIPVVTNDNSFVKVNFIITKEGVDIPKGSVISVQQSGIIGEKFLEITPPPLNKVELPVSSQKYDIQKGIPVLLRYENKNYRVGEVKGSQIISKVVEEYKTTRKGIELNEVVKDYYEISYIIDRAGLEIPEMSNFRMQDDMKALVIEPPAEYIVHIPADKKKFTTEDPLRIKKFMELQVESAEALKATNDKINQLLQPEQIDNLKDTLRNTKILTARATDIMDQANLLMIDSKSDLKRLVDSSANLSDNMITVSDNINAIIGDPQLRSDIIETVHSIKQSTNELRDIISDPNLKETIALTKETSANVSELVTYLKDAASNKELKEKLSTTITNLNQSLDKLSELLERTDRITANQEGNIKQIVTDSAEISQNMKKFSKKLNKRFLLFRLLF
jgi:ABC-type transporter Mla subunit MlaD